MKAIAFTKEVMLTPAFDRRHSDPSKDCGIHGCELRFYLKGPKGVIQFVVYTNWQLPHVTDELFREKDIDTLRTITQPMAADVGYHSPVPMYEGQQPMEKKCWLLGGICYYDGSSLNAEPILDVLLREGSDGVWRELEDWYRTRFEQ